MIFPYFDKFIANYSERARRYIQTKFTLLANWMDKQHLKLQDLKAENMTNFLQDILNKKKMRAVTKRKFAQTYMAYFKILVDYELLPKNPMPSTRINYDDFISDKMAENALTEELDIENINILIQHAKRVNKRMYVFLVLLAYNGMRQSELRSVKIEHINFDTKAIASGLVVGHQKEFLCLYFVPDNFIIYLKNYIAELKSLYVDPIYLFHESTSELGFISERSINRDLSKYKNLLQIKCKVNAHSFRGCLNNERLRLECPDSVMAILLNQQPTGTNAAFYLKLLKKNLKERRKYWVKYCPQFKI